jgi:hypothetical protein
MRPRHAPCRASAPAGSTISTAWRSPRRCGPAPSPLTAPCTTTDAEQVCCNFSPTGRSWDFDGCRTIGRLLYQQQPVERANWLFAEQELQVDGLEMEEAIGLVQDLVLIASGGRFRPQVTSPDPAVHLTRITHRTRMERSDQG